MKKDYGQWRKRNKMDFIRNYWPQLIAFITLVMALTTMKVDIDVLKDKVKTLFELWNRDRK